MRTLCSAILLFSCILILGFSASGQDASTGAINSQTSGNDCAPTEGKWNLIYPASNASYVGGSIPEMHMSEGNRFLRALLQELQFRRNGRIALAPGCLLFAFNAEKDERLETIEKDTDGSFKINANYRILRCSNKVTLSDADKVCKLAADKESPASYVLTIPYAKVNVLSRAKYATSDLSSVSTAYVGFSAGVLAAIASSISKASTTAQVLGVGGAAASLAAYYFIAIASPRMGDNYIAVFVEPPASKINLSRKSNRVTVTTSSLHSFHAGQQIQVSDFANSELTNISEISRDAKGIVKVTIKPPHDLPVGAQVQIADVTDDPSLNGQFQVASAPSSTTFTYEQKDLLKKAVGPFGTGKVQDVWNGTFPIESVTHTTLTYVQVGPDNQTASKGTVAAPPQNTTLTVTGNLAGNRPRAPNSRSATLTGTATLSQPPPDDLFKKGDLMMFRIPNHHDYFNISMILSGGTGLTFVSETAEKTGK